MFKVEENGKVQYFTGGPVVPISDREPVGLAALMCKELGRTPTLDEIQKRWDELHGLERNPDGTLKQPDPVKAVVKSLSAAKKDFQKVTEQVNKKPTIDLVALKRLYRKAFLRYATKQIENLTDEEEEDIAHLIDDVNVVSFKTWLSSRGYIGETGS